MERLVGQVLGRYTLIQLLGEGGMGAVFKASDVTLQRDVAIKIMHPHLAKQADFRERFLQEARTAARLDHPGVVQVFDFGSERTSQGQDLLYIVMKFIQGANLRQMLEELKAQGQWIPLDEAVQIIRQIATAMHYTHRQGVLHRDLKPSNVMIEPEPSDGLPYRAVLTDLGLARLMEGQRITRAGTSMGTPTYMSPEQALGEETDARSDVYALGVMLYELVVGHPPFPIRTISEAIRYHTKEMPRPPTELRPDLPKSLERIILKAMAKDPATRWDNAGELATKLSAIAQEVTAVGATPTAVEDSVSLMTQYQKSLLEPRGASLLREFDTPTGGGAIIQARLPDGSELEIPVSSRTITVGRTEENDLVLDTANVSRRHARIEIADDVFRVSDLNSTNGTYLGNARLLPGVPETWTPDRSLRIGDVWLRLVVKPREAPTSKLGGVTAVGVAAERPAGRSLIRSSTGEGRIGLVLKEPHLSTTPGERRVTTLVLLNQGSIVDHFRVEVGGVPAEWVTLPPVVQLMPGQQQEVVLTLQPPRSSESKAGRYTIAIRVLSRDNPAQSVEATASLTLAPFSQFQSSLHPQQVRAGKATRVTIQNQGNYPETFTLVGADRANALNFEPNREQIQVGQGETASADIRAAPLKRPLIGGQKLHPFTIQVAASQGASKQHAGELVSKGLIPSWVPPLVMGLFLITCVALALLLTRSPVIELAEVIPPNPEAGQPVTIRWRVSNTRRIELRPFGVEVAPEVGEYTFETGFGETASVNLVAANLFRTTREALTIPVNVVVTDPVINEWSVFPTEITQGQEVIIRWSVSNADSVRVQPFGTVDNSGERRDTPQQTETYTLIVTNQGRSVEQSERVVVTQPAADAPQITTFSGNPTTVVAEQDTTVQIAWATEQADTVTIEPGLGPVGLSGSRDVPAPGSDTIYTLVARGPGGETQAQVQIYVQVQRCLVAVAGLKLREGPGTAYEPPLASLPAGAQLTPLAYSNIGYPDGQWVRVRVVDGGQEGWVARSFLTDCNVDVTGLGDAPFPPTPMPIFEVTAVQATANPVSYGGSCPAVFDFSGQITANGAGTVTYRWLRSDGATAPEQTLDFDSAGTKTVDTSWSLSAEGNHWQRLQILSPNNITSNQAEFALECMTEIAYVHRGDMAAANSYKALLEDNGYTVDLIAMGAIMTTDFSDYSLILIGPDTGGGSTWGDAAGNQANRIETSDKPVLGLGQGGYAFFGRLGFPIGYGKGWSSSGREVYAVSPDHRIWKEPNEIALPANRIVALYSANSPFVAIHYPSSISGIRAIGRQRDATVHYQLISKDAKYLLWGFSNPPSMMTDVGRRVFVNAVDSTMPRFILINPPIFQP